MDNGYVTARVLYRHGENDFALWTVELKETDYEDAMQDIVRMKDTIEAVMNNLPLVDDEPETVCHFLFVSKDNAIIITSQVNKEFIEQYHNEGFSVRGFKQDIMDEVQKESRIIIPLTPQEASAVSAVLELELCNCDEPEREALLESAMQQINQAICSAVAEMPENEDEEEL